MIDHVSIKVSDLGRSRAFYEAALAPLGYRVVMDLGSVVGMGTGGDAIPDFWLGQGTVAAADRVHLAFGVPYRRLVDEFHQAALEAGGRNNGAPGVRTHYHAHYYAAFVLDPDGCNVEVVCHRPGGMED